MEMKCSSRLESCYKWKRKMKSGELRFEFEDARWASRKRNPSLTYPATMHFKREDDSDAVD